MMIRAYIDKDNKEFDIIKNNYHMIDPTNEKIHISHINNIFYYGSISNPTYYFKAPFNNDIKEKYYINLRNKKIKNLLK